VRRSIVAIALAAIAASAPAGAQVYAPGTPAPRTTSVPAMRALATAREVEERFRIGLEDQADGKWSASALEFARIVQLHPSEPKGSTAYYDLGIAYAHLDRNAEAATAFRSAIQIDREFLAAMANLISVDIAAGDLKEARAVADRYVTIAPDSARAVYSRGIVALQTGDAATARTDFGKLLSLDPAYAVAHYGLALAEERLRSYGEAERELRTALALAPNYARAEFALGVVLLAQARRPQARDAFARACQLSTGDPALSNLAASMRDSITR
jgi:Flp pilus assembly protein TadD